MRMQRVTREDGVKGGYVAGVGATPVLRTSRVGSAALVAPTPATSMYQTQTESGPESVPTLDRSEYPISSGPVLVRVPICIQPSPRTGRKPGQRGTSNEQI